MHYNAVSRWKYGEERVGGGGGSKGDLTRAITVPDVSTPNNVTYIIGKHLRMGTFVEKFIKKNSDIKYLVPK